MILNALLERRSIENPSTPLDDPADWLYDTLSGGERSSSGIRVTPQTAMSYAAVWRAVSLIASYVAKIPLDTFQRLDDGGKEKARQHPAFRLLRRKPNDWMTAFDVKQTLTAHALLTGRGNGYAYIFRGGNGEPEELWPLNPLATWPTVEAGRLWYITTLEDTQRKLPPSEVLHIKGLGFDGLQGYDVITYAKEHIGLGLAIRKYGSVFFKNGATPGIVLERPLESGPMDEGGEQTLRKSFDSIVTGLDNAHRTAVLQEGMKATVLAVDARKSQLIEMREHEVRQIAALLGVPPHKLGDPTRTSYNSLEQENASFLEDALDPWFCRWEDECYDKLLTEREKEADTHFMEFNRDAAIRVDTKTLVESLVQEVNNGLLSPDEARAIRNRPPIPDGLGETFWKPQNIGQIGQPDAGAERSHYRLLLETLQRMHRRVCTHARRAAKVSDEFLDWLDERMEEDHRQVFINAVGPVLEAGIAARVIDRSWQADAIAERYFADVRGGLLTVSECQPAELAERVAEWSTELGKVMPGQVADVVCMAIGGDSNAK